MNKFLDLAPGINMVIIILLAGIGIVMMKGFVNLVEGRIDQALEILREISTSLKA